MLELVLFSLPSLVYLFIFGRAKRLGRRAAMARIGASRGTGSGYLLALALAVPLALLAYLVLFITPTAPSEVSGVSVTVASVGSAAGILSAIARASGEEIFFRGLVGGFLQRRLGFARGNLVQALIFVLPHAALLFFDAGFWPVLPVQFVAGWLLGLLRHRSGSFVPCAILHAATNLAAGWLAV